MVPLRSPARDGRRMRGHDRPPEARGQVGRRDASRRYVRAYPDAAATRAARSGSAGACYCSREEPGWLGEYGSSRASVLVDQTAKDINALDACVGIVERLDSSQPARPVPAPPTRCRDVAYQCCSDPDSRE